MELYIIVVCNYCIGLENVLSRIGNTDFTQVGSFMLFSVDLKCIPGQAGQNDNWKLKMCLLRNAEKYLEWS